MPFPRMRSLSLYSLAAVLLLGALAPMIRAEEAPPASSQTAEADPRIPITFTLAQPGYVTLVVEDEQGVRVRNLISETQFPAGTHTVMWDGMDDRERDKAAAQAAIFHIPGKMVAPGKYTVRGLSHPQIDIVYELTPYTSGNPPWRTEDGGSQWLTNHSSPSDVIFLPAGKAPEREGKPTSKGAQVVICSRVAEGGSGVAWVDMDGKKLWGQHWLGGVWTAASHLAVDRGDKPVAGVYAYAAASWPGDKYNENRSELRLHKMMEPGHTRAAPRDKRFGTGEDRPVLEPTYTIPNPPGVPEKIDNKNERGKLMASLTGLAVRNGIIACAFEKLNHILWVDAANSKVIGTSNVTAPGGLAFDLQGNLYVLSEKKLLRYKMDLANPLAMTEPTSLVTDLEDPQNVTIADDGTIYVSDWGTSHQVKVFANDGKPLKQIGVAGVPRSGPYDPNHMNKPAGMALDDRGRLWVTENTHIPKRISVWNLSDGKLATAFYGPMRYGGSGSLSPADKTRFFYDDDHGGTLEFKLDYATGQSTPVAIPYLSTEDASGIKGRYVGGPPSYPLINGKFLYLTNAHSQSTSGRRNSTIWRMDSDGMARLVAAAGSVLDASNDIMPAFTEPAMAAKLAQIVKSEPTKPGAKPAENANVLFVWADANGDQKLQPEEVQFLDPSEYAEGGKKVGNMGSVNVTDDLAFTIATVGNVVLNIAPTSINEAGVPQYDLAQRKVLAKDVNRPASTGGGQVLTGKDGWLITTTPVKPFDAAGLGGVRNGKPMWSYPSLWPGLHASHIAPMPKEPGQLIGTTRVIGNIIDPLPGSDSGQLWAINANKGTIYIFTVDGLFVTRLFQDSRTASWNAPEAKRGMTVNNLSLQEECFGPVWTRTNEGEVYLQGGGCGNICRLVNLDKIKRLDDQSITLSAEQLEKAQQAAVLAEAKRQEEGAANSKPLKAIVRTQAMVIDGKLDDWLNINWVNIDKRSQSTGNWSKRELTTRAAATVWEDKLVLAWQTGDKDLLRSSGESMNNLFKCGGALDVFIGTNADAAPSRRKAVAGDQRLLITLVKDKSGDKDKAREKVAAVLYEPVSAEKKGPTAEFGSPLRTLKFDRVEVVSDQIQLASSTEKDLKADKDGKVVITTYEVAIPLSLLNLKPEAGKSYKFDIGVLRGNGQETLQRSYWTNKASGLVSDIPSEAELIPALWGIIQFGQRTAGP